ncbi:hypothetical protein [Pseudonocardia kunmingensis]|uniref:Uncharacterized protein n=1 Tax=Pseudonocardia kunmingensis TaxID=630975 RepID=A0A543CXS9_9PSEU|nr:hypothetical protein [Pseudonocardia kunmingensis]TQM01895.1 hypothetical protein FB558_8414 [Pseudonocardia kunmingensis]
MSAYGHRAVTCGDLRASLAFHLLPAREAHRRDHAAGSRVPDQR